VRFEQIRIRNLGPFAEVDLDLRGIDGKIVAVAGANGAGKSTLLELLAGGLYRATPTRGKLSELATGRDSFVEVRAVNGAAYTIRHTVDAVSGKGESLVLDASGAPVLSSGKVREFDGWAATALPAPEVFYSSVFSAQGSGGFLEAKPGDRKAILLRVLGIEYLEGLAERAREHERGTRQSLAVTQARLVDEQERGLDVTEAERQLADAVQASTVADANLEAAKVELARVEESARQVEQAKCALDSYLARKSDLERTTWETRTKLADLRARLANNRHVLDDAEQIRAAVAEVERLRAEIVELQGKRDSAARDYQEHTRAVLDARRRADEAGRRAASARERIQAAQRRLEDTAAIEHAVSELERLRDVVGVAAAKRLEFKEALDALRGQRVVGMEGRVEGLRDGLRMCAMWREDSHSYDDDMGHPRRDFGQEDWDQMEAHASEVLQKDDEPARLAEELPRQIADANRNWDAAEQDLWEAKRALEACERLAARAPDLDLAHQDLAAARRDLETADEEIGNASRRAEIASKNAALAEIERRGLHEAVQSAEVVLAKAETIAIRVKHLESAQARVDELQPQIDEAEADLRFKVTVYDQMGDPPEVPQGSDLEAARFAMRQAERAARDAHAAPPVREHTLAQARESAERAAQLEQDRAGIEAELADWAKLAQDLGRSGLQAYEVDAVGPELTELVNDLLQTCVGPRWTVSIETQRNSADGKKVLEGCDVRVIDTERGREASAESLSGGERVLVGEAVALALSMLACRRAGVDGPTLVRDETGAALDPSNGRAYVAMLRRAAEIVGASQVLFVSHSPDVQELADARIVVADGKVEVT